MASSAQLAVLSTPASFIHLRRIVIFLLFNPVHCLERISVFAGSDILLPCSYRPDPSSPSSKPYNVFWRYEDAHSLYDIIAGKPDLEPQDKRFRGRTRTFPHLYAEGNFSVVLMNVSLNDNGAFYCKILGYKQQLQLIVTVYGHERIDAFVGEDVLLPCSYTTSSILVVSWYYKGLYSIIDIIYGKTYQKRLLLPYQERFRNRIRTFPHLYAEGNFSVVLMNVSLNDAGPYNCDILMLYQRQLELTVKGKPIEKQPTASSTEVSSGGRVIVPCDVIITMAYMFSVLCII